MNDGAIIALVIVAAIALLPVVYAIVIFNRLVGLRALVKNAWGNIDVELKRRHNLIPRLVEVVKGYASHERAVFDDVLRARSAAMASDAPTRGHAADESALSRATRGLLAVAEGYPDLKADAPFRRLQDELVRTEDRIAAARRFFNGNVKDLNTLVEQFPSGLVARSFGVEPADYFEVETTLEREAPAVGPMR